MLEALISEFEAIEDPRCDWKVEHRLVDILVIAVCAVVGKPRASRTSRSTAAASRLAARLPRVAERHSLA